MKQYSHDTYFNSSPLQSKVQNVYSIQQRAESNPSFARRKCLFYYVLLLIEYYSSVSFSSSLSLQHDISYFEEKRLVHILWKRNWNVLEILFFCISFKPIRDRKREWTSNRKACYRQKHTNTLQSAVFKCMSVSPSEHRRIEFQRVRVEFRFDHSPLRLIFLGFVSS